MTAPLGLTIRQSILSRADEVIEWATGSEFPVVVAVALAATPALAQS
jgi:hypothetical protein